MAPAHSERCSNSTPRPHRWPWYLLPLLPLCCSLCCSLPDLQLLLPIPRLGPASGCLPAPLYLEPLSSHMRNKWNLALTLKPELCCPLGVKMLHRQTQGETETLTHTDEGSLTRHTGAQARYTEPETRSGGRFTNSCRYAQEGTLGPTQQMQKAISLLGHTATVCKACVGTLSNCVSQTPVPLCTHTWAHTHTLQHHTHRRVHTLPSGARNGPEPSLLGWGRPAASHGGKVSWRTMRPLFYHPRSQKQPLLGRCAPQGRLSTVSPGGCACVWERKPGCSPGPPAPVHPPGTPPPPEPPAWSCRPQGA